jgi:hypothetical protein
MLNVFKRNEEYFNFYNLAIFGMKHVKQDVLENTFFEPLAAR